MNCFSVFDHFVGLELKVLGFLSQTMTIHITVEERKGPLLTFAPIYKYSDIDFVDNKAQGQISKWVLQEKKARQIF